MSARPRSPSEQCEAEDPQEITSGVPEPMQVGVSDKAEDGLGSTASQQDVSEALELQLSDEEDLTSK